MARVFSRASWMVRLVQAPYDNSSGPTKDDQDEPHGQLWGAPRGPGLRTRLGKWFDAEGPSELVWWHCEVENRLYRQLGGQWYSHGALPTRTRQTLFHREANQVIACSPHCKRGIVLSEAARLRLLGSSPVLCSEPRAQLSPEWTQIDPRTTGTCTREGILRSLVEGTLCGMSDGSAKDGFATASWILTSPDRMHSLSADAIVPGPTESLDAYRTELIGLYAMVCAISQLAGDTTSSISVSLGCDGLSALQEAFHRQDPVSPRQPDYDVFGTIRNLRAQSSHITWNVKHVKGHQDSDPSVVLDFWALLNVEMDTQAKAAWAKHCHRSPRRCYIPGAPWTVWVQGDCVVRELPQRPENHCAEVSLRSWWESRALFQQLQR